MGHKSSSYATKKCKKDPKFKNECSMIMHKTLTKKSLIISLSCVMLQGRGY